MKGIVSIFGGVNTKEKYFRHAIEIYKKNNYDVFFYPTSGMKCLIPEKFNKNVNKAYDNLMYKNDPNIKKIIHCYSGGFWSGLKLNELYTHDAIILEAGPFPIYNMDNFRSSFAKIIGIPLPLYGLEYALSILGIPTPTYGQDYLIKYEHQLLQLRKIIIMNGEKDEFLDKKYVKQIITQLKNNNIDINYISFTDGTHWTIPKSDLNLYKSTINNVLLTI